MRQELVDALARAGIRRDGLIDLRGGNVAQTPLRYVDLVRARRDEDLVPDAVSEVDKRPFLYVYDGSRLETLAPSWPDVQAIIASRADAPFVGVLTGTTLRIWRVAASLVTWAHHDFDVGLDKPIRPIIQSLVRGEQLSSRANVAWLDERLFDLLWQAAKKLREECGSLSDSDLLSIVGRALFVRYLADRGYFEGTQSDQLFNSPESVITTFERIDAEFNGNLLELSGSYAGLFKDDRQATALIQTLQNVMHAAKDDQLELGWSNIRFNHVPVDLLSQVYEAFMHRFRSKKAKEKSIHYTPRHIAELLVDDAMQGLDSKLATDIQVLDPAAGGGVFLVLALRKLVERRRDELGQMPQSQEIRRILYEQIHGCDIDADALKFAALSLYLTVLDLEAGAAAVPIPFRDLRDCTLTDVGAGRSGIGSIDWVAQKQFNLVIGNPPWTKLDRAQNSAVQKVLATLQSDAVRHDAAASNLRNAADVPFLWKATQWAKPGAVIAFAMHSRFLLRREDGNAARRAIFNSMRVTGIVNGALLRNSQRIWPGITAPWCLFFALNERPRHAYQFSYYAPVEDNAINALGWFRLDPAFVHVLSTDQLERQPDALKVLLRGNAPDLEIVRKLSTRRHCRLKDWVTASGLTMSDGYQKTDGGKKDASHMIGMPDFELPPKGTYAVVTSSLPKFQRPVLHRDRDPSIYRAPIVLVKESPSPDRRSIPLAYLCPDDTAYSESYWGISTASLGDEALPTARSLHAILNSSVFFYWLLMTSAKFGVERDSAQELDLQLFPLPWKDRAGPQDLKMLQSLSQEIDAGTVDWAQLDRAVGQLYRLNHEEIEHIEESIQLAGPSSKARQKAASVPSQAQLSAFQRTLADHLELAQATTKLDVKEVRQASTGWVVYAISTDVDETIQMHAAQLAVAFTGIAGDLHASRLIAFTGPRSFLVGQLAQQRFWTQSAAISFAAELLSNTREQTASHEHIFQAA